MLWNKKNNIFSLFIYIWFLIIYSCFEKYNCVMTVFPESVLPEDEIFSKSKPENLEQIYRAGLFITKSFHSQKTGIYYEAGDNCNQDIENETITKNKFTNININIYDKFRNFSNEEELFHEYIASREIICNAPFPKIVNPNYELTYKFPVYTVNSNKISISFNDNIVCFQEMNGLSLFYFEIVIKYIEPNMVFQCTTPSSDSFSEIEIDDPIKVKFSSDSGEKLYLTSYIVTFVDSSENEAATYNGMEECENDLSKPNACLPNYICDGGKCKKCDASCNRCKNSGIDKCTKCNVLTTYEPEGNTCNINYVNLMNYNSINYRIPAITSGRVTMGFWLFLPDITANGKFNILITDFLSLDFEVDGSSTVTCYVYPTLFSDEFEYNASYKIISPRILSKDSIIFVLIKYS